MRLLCLSLGTFSSLTGILWMGNRVWRGPSWMEPIAMGSSGPNSAGLLGLLWTLRLKECIGWTAVTIISKPPLMMACTGIFCRDVLFGNACWFLSFVHTFWKSINCYFNSVIGKLWSTVGQWFLIRLALLCLSIRSTTLTGPRWPLWRLINTVTIAHKSSTGPLWDHMAWLWSMHTDSPLVRSCVMYITLLDVGNKIAVVFWFWKYCISLWFWL